MVSLGGRHQELVMVGDGSCIKEQKKVKVQTGFEVMEMVRERWDQGMNAVVGKEFEVMV